MNYIRFLRPDSGMCPAYGEYYIKDRTIGKNVYGHETYQYALFRRNSFHLVRKFRTRKQAYIYVSELTGISQWDVKMGSNRIICGGHGGEFLGVLYGM